MSKWDGKTNIVLNAAVGCGHNGLVLTKQKTFLLACDDVHGAILELDMTGKELRRWETDSTGQKLDGGINNIVLTANGGAYATLSGPFVDPPVEVLGKILTKVSAKVAPPVVVPSPPRRPDTLWERIGGKQTFTKVIDDLMDAALKDAKVDFTRGGKFKFDDAALKKLKDQFVALGSSVSGGPEKYTGPSMKELHKGMGITDAQFDALVGHLKKALEKNGIKPEDAAALLKAVETTRGNIVER